MPVIDDEGNLFGLVNVVDALVVLLVFAVVAAGVALVNPFASSAEEATRYATVDLGEQREYVAEIVSEGDVLSPPNSGSDVTVTDVYVTPVSAENVSVRVRVRMEGQLVESEQTNRPVFALAGTSIRRGTTLQMGSDEYIVEGTVVSSSESGESLSTREMGVTVSSTVSSGTAESISRGDSFVVGGQTVGVIEDIHVAPMNRSDMRRVTIGLTLETINESGAFFAEKQVALGRKLTFRSDGYSLRGTVDSVGSSTVRTGNESVVLRASVSSDTARLISDGDTYRVAGNQVARITEVRAYPSAGDGQRTVFLGVELTTVNRSDGQYVGNRLVRVGTPVPFQTAEYQLTGTVVTKGSLTLPGETTTRTVEVKLESVPPAVAESLSAGMVERSGSSVSARVSRVEVEPAVVALTSESGDIYRREHPVKKDVYLTMELSARETPSGLFFHGESLQVNRTVLLDFSTVTVEGTVVRIPTTESTNSTRTRVSA